MRIVSQSGQCLLVVGSSSLQMVSGSDIERCANKDVKFFERNGL